MAKYNSTIESTRAKNLNRIVMILPVDLAEEVLVEAVEDEGEGLLEVSAAGVADDADADMVLFWFWCLLMKDCEGT